MDKNKYPHIYNGGAAGHTSTMCFCMSLSGPSLESDTYTNEWIEQQNKHTKRKLDTYNIFMALRLEPLADTELYEMFEVSINYVVDYLGLSKRRTWFSTVPRRRGSLVAASPPL